MGVAQDGEAPGDPRSLRLFRFGLRDLTLASSTLRRCGEGASSMEEVAREVVGYLHGALRAEDGATPACALVRLFKTHELGELEPPLREHVLRSAEGSELSPETMCLTLLATAGVEDAWSSRHASVSHRAIPLPDPSTLERLPMVARLVHQLGVSERAFLGLQDSPLLALETRNFNVLHVERALGSPFLPAQDDFVRPYGIASVVGFGGMLPSGKIFVVILFSRVPIPRATAELFRTLALSVKVALLPFDEGKTFE